MVTKTRRAPGGGGEGGNNSNPVPTPVNGAEQNPVPGAEQNSGAGSTDPANDPSNGNPDNGNPDGGQSSPSGDGEGSNNVNKLTDEVRKLIKARGGKTLQATRVSIDAKQVENLAKGLASDAMEKYKSVADQRAEESGKKPETRGRKIFEAAAVAGLTAVGFVGAGFIGAGIVAGAAVGQLIRRKADASIKKGNALRNYYNVAKKAIKETGNLDAGKAAIEKLKESDFREKRSKSDAAIVERKWIVKEVAEKNKAGEGSEQYTFERAKEAFKDSDTKDLATENGEKFEENVENDNAAKIKSALAEYANEYAGKGEEEAKKSFDKAMEMQREDLKKESNALEVKGNYDDLLSEVREIVDQVKNDDKFKDYSLIDKQKALSTAIDEAVKVNEAKMKAGINTTEVLTASEKATLKWGVLAGALVGLASGAMRTATRSSVNRVVGAAAAGVAGAAIGGFIAGRKMKKDLQRRNVKQALGLDDAEGTAGVAEGEANTKAGRFGKLLKKLSISEVNGEKVDFHMESVDDLRTEMDDLIANINDPDSRAAAIDVIARYDAANKLQNLNENKFKLLKFKGGRESVEKSRFEITKSKVALKKALKDTFGADAIDAELNDAISAKMEEMGADVDSVKKARLNAILVAAGKGALYAGAASLIGRAAFVHGKGAAGSVAKWLEEKRVALYQKLFDDGANDYLKATTFFAAVPSLHDQRISEIDEKLEARRQRLETERAAKVKTEVIDDSGEAEQKAFVEKVRSTKAPMLIEDDPDGGVQIGFDVNGDGDLDQGEFLFGEGSEKGLLLNTDEGFNTLNEKLEEFDLYAEKGDYNIEKLVNMTGREFIEDQKGNTGYMEVVETNINKISSKSKTLVTIHRPTACYTSEGLDYFEVSIDGNIPEGACAYVDIDGDGPLEAMKFPIRSDGKVLVPAGVVDAESFAKNGKANFIGRFAVGIEEEDGSFTSFGADSGKFINEDATFMASKKATGSIITVIDNESKDAWAQVAITDEGKRETASNLSHLFNGDHGRVPRAFVTGDIDGRDKVIMAGLEVEDFDYNEDVGYLVEYDSGANQVFKTNSNNWLVGIPLDADVNGDGIFDEEERARFIRETMIAIGTDKEVLEEYASGLDVLKADKLKDILFDGDEEKMLKTFEEWGIKGDIDNYEELRALEKVITSRSLKPSAIARDIFGGDTGKMQSVFDSLGINGEIDTKEELDIFNKYLELEKMNPNEYNYSYLDGAKYYGKLVNGTIDAYQEEIKDAELRLETIVNRQATFSDGNNGWLLDDLEVRNNPKKIIYYVKKDEYGNDVYLCNKGFIAERELGAGKGGKVGVMPNCRQFATPKGNGGGSTPKIPVEPGTPVTPPVTPPETPPVETPPEIKPKDPELMREMDAAVNDEIAKEAGVDRVEIEKLDVNQGNTVPTLPKDDAGAGDIVTNEAATRTVERGGQVVPAAEEVNVSAANDYSQNLNEPTGVYKPDIDAQEEANRIAAENAEAIRIRTEQETAERLAHEEALRKAAEAEAARQQAEAEAARRAQEAAAARQEAADLEAARLAQQRAEEAAAEAARAQQEEAAARAAVKQTEEVIAQRAQDEDELLGGAIEDLRNAN